MLTDYGYHHSSDTPLMLLKRFPRDEEHSQLAWLARVRCGETFAMRTTRTWRRMRKSFRVRCVVGLRTRTRWPCARSPRCRVASLPHALHHRPGTRAGRTCVLRSRLVALAMLALIASSCGNARDPSRVGMERDQTNITFGFTASAAARARALGPQAALGLPTGPVQTPLPTFSPIFETHTPPVGPCPTADPTAPVSSRAPTEVSGRTSVGDVHLARFPARTRSRVRRSRSRTFSRTTCCRPSRSVTRSRRRLAHPKAMTSHTERSSRAWTGVTNCSIGRSRPTRDRHRIPKADSSSNRSTMQMGTERSRGTYFKSQSGVC